MQNPLTSMAIVFTGIAAVKVGLLFVRRLRHGRYPLITPAYRRQMLKQRLKDRRGVLRLCPKHLVAYVKVGDMAILDTKNCVSCAYEHEESA